MSKIIKGKFEKATKEQFKKYSDTLEKLIGEKHGIYALFNENKEGNLNLFYVGKTNRDLKRRVKEQLKEKRWSHFSLYLTNKKEYTDEIEALILSIHTPKGNTKKEKVDAENLWDRFQKLEKKQTRPHDSKKNRNLKSNSKIPSPKKNKTKDLKRLRFYCKVKDADAKGAFLSNGEFRVFKGSKCCLKETPRAGKSILDKRSELKERHILKEKKGVLVFTKDEVFGSLNEASKVVIGRRSNALTSWKTKDKKTFKELRGQK